jgi:predicted ATPase/DNA-binding SARP family transcriptional activator
MVTGRLTFRALGPLEVRVGGAVADLGPAKQRAVLAVLLALSPDAVPVERLVDEVWPSGGPRQPLRSLQVYVSALRQAFDPDGRWLTTVGRAYRLAVPQGAFDVLDFTADADLAGQAARSGDPEGALENADRALALWAGEAWQDVREVPGIGPDAARLDELRLDVRSVRAGALLALGRHRDLVPELEELVSRHPLREDLRGHLMLALHRSGRRSEALEVYAAGRATLVEETGLEPASELRTLQAQILEDDPTLLVEDADLRARRHLPSPATPLLGRAEDVDDLAGLLRSGVRLLTVTGPGGVGKTRTSLEVAHASAATFEDGVWFVDLSELTGARQVPQAVAEALDVDPSGDDFEGPLTAHVAHRRLLLVLDNFEQVEDAADLVAKLLMAGEGLQVLVTSRVPLRVYGEQVRPLGPLAADDAVALFSARALAADPRFDTSQVTVVRGLCDSLDGLPLAIELVAARTADFRLQEIQERIGHRLDLAADGPRDRSLRQRSLRAAIEWSTALLPDDQRESFARLGVFAGGWVEQAALEIGGVTREQLNALSRAGLVVSDSGRYRMLETVRDFAVERLAADPGAGELRDRHAAFLGSLAAQARPGMKGPEAVALIARLRQERANLRAALNHLHSRGAFEDLLRLAASLTVFWYRTSAAGEDVGWVGRALALAPDADPHLRARAHFGLAICRSEQGNSAEALVSSHEAYLLFKKVGDLTWAARALNTVAGTTRDHGDAAGAIPLGDEAIALRRSLKNPELPLGIALANRGISALDVDDLDGARRFLAEARELAGADPVEQALVDTLLADLAVAEDDVPGAQDRLRTAIPVLREFEHDYRLIECLDTFAAIAVRRGRAEDAALLVAAADRAMAEEGASQVVADALMRQRRISGALSGMAEAPQERGRARGGAMCLDEAIDHAMSELLGPP